ncbi:DMT family transporter [candidate division TA06 bacterium]|nr:DMT family transporter [candidate division TA06 bacterium]
MTNRHLKADLWLLLATFFWGVTFVAVKDAMLHATPLVFMGVRFALAGVILLPFCYRGLKTLPFKGWRDGIILGSFLFGGFALQTAGLVHTTATRSAFITGLSVILVPPLSITMLKKKVGPWIWTGVALAAVGLYFLSRPASGGFNRGDLLTALCAACFAVEIILVQTYTQKHGAMNMVMVQIITTVFLSLLFMWRLERPAIHFVPSLWLDLLLTSGLATAGSLVIQSHYQKQTSAARVAVIYTLEPLFAAVFAFLIFGEKMPWLGWLGASLIMVGMLSSEFGKE